MIHVLFFDRQSSGWENCQTGVSIVSMLICMGPNFGRILWIGRELLQAKCAVSAAEGLRRQSPLYSTLASITNRLLQEFITALPLLSSDPSILAVMQRLRQFVSLSLFKQDPSVIPSLSSTCILPSATIGTLFSRRHSEATAARLKELDRNDPNYLQHKKRILRPQNSGRNEFRRKWQKSLQMQVRPSYT